MDTYPQDCYPALVALDLLLLDICLFLNQPQVKGKQQALQQHCHQLIVLIAHLARRLQAQTLLDNCYKLVCVQSKKAYLGFGRQLLEIAIIVISKLIYYVLIATGLKALPQLVKEGQGDLILLLYPEQQLTALQQHLVELLLTSNIILVYLL